MVKLKPMLIVPGFFEVEARRFLASLEGLNSSLALSVGSACHHSVFAVRKGYFMIRSENWVTIRPTKEIFWQIHVSF